MEFLDVLNEDGSLTGTQVSREEAHQKGYLHKAVVLFLIRIREGGPQVLLQKRSMHKKLWPGKWDVSAGGHVEAGTTGIETASLETKQELGLDISESKITFIGSSKNLNTENGIVNNHINEYYVAYCDKQAEEMTLQESEVDQAKWINLSDLKNMVWDKDEKLAPKWDAYESLFTYLKKLTRRKVNGN